MYFLVCSSGKPSICVRNGELLLGRLNVSSGIIISVSGNILPFIYFTKAHANARVMIKEWVMRGVIEYQNTSYPVNISVKSSQFS